MTSPDTTHTTDTALIEHFARIQFMLDDYTERFRRMERKLDYALQRLDHMTGAISHEMPSRGDGA